MTRSIVIHRVDFEIYEDDYYDEFFDYFNQVFDGDILLVYGTVPSCFSGFMLSRRHYVLQRRTTSAELEYLCGFIAWVNNERDYLISEVFGEKNLSLESINSEAHRFFEVFNKISAGEIIGHNSAPNNAEAGKAVDSISPDIIRANLREIFYFIEMTRVHFEKISRGVPVSFLTTTHSELSKTIYSYNNFAIDPTYKNEFENKFSSIFSKVNLISKAIRIFSQDFINPATLSHFPDFYCILIISLEAQVKNAIENKNFSLYCIYISRCIEIIASGHLIEKGFAEYDIRGKLILSNKAVLLIRSAMPNRHSASNNISGVGILLSILFHSNTISQNEYNDLNKIINMRNKIKETHGFLNYTGNDYIEIDKIYINIKKILLTTKKQTYESIRNEFNEISILKIIENFIHEKLIKSFFFSS